MDYCTIAIVKVVLVTTLAKIKVAFTNIAIVVNPSRNGNLFAIYNTPGLLGIFLFGTWPFTYCK
jgi:hypothetical protein